MQSAAETYKASKPHKGQPVYLEGELAGEVVRVEDTLCWTKYYSRGDTLPFIWCFADNGVFPGGLNTLHDWPTKSVHSLPRGDGEG